MAVQIPAKIFTFQAKRRQRQEKAEPLALNNTSQKLCPCFTYTPSVPCSHITIPCGNGDAGERSLFCAQIIFLNSFIIEKWESRYCILPTASSTGSKFPGESLLDQQRNECEDTNESLFYIREEMVCGVWEGRTEASLAREAQMHWLRWRDEAADSKKEFREKEKM